MINFKICDQFCRDCIAGFHSFPCESTRNQALMRNSLFKFNHHGCCDICCNRLQYHMSAFINLIISFCLFPQFLSSNCTVWHHGWHSDNNTAFQTQGPRFKPQLSQVLKICVDFSAKVDSDFYPYEVGKMITGFCLRLSYDRVVSCLVGVNDSHPIQKPEVRI